MILSGKKYSSKGRIRFGSSLFIDDSHEQISDSIRGFSRSSSLKYALILLIGLKLVTSNAIGIIVALVVFYVTYIVSVRKLHLQFTVERVLVISEFKYQRSVLVLGYIFIGISVYTSLNFIFADYTNLFNDSLVIMEGVFEFFRFLPVFFVAYEKTVSFYKIELIRLDSLVTLIVYLFYGIQFVKMKYHFQEIHFAHISEQIIKLSKSRNPLLLPLIIFTGILSQSILFDGFNLVTTLLFITIYLYASNTSIAKLSLFGAYGRPLLHEINLQSTEFFRATRATAAIFGWEHQGNYYSRPFPYNVIPKEVSSYYETGLRASSIEAFNQANVIGLILSSFTNLFVVLLLFKFAFENDQDQIVNVLLIAIGLIVMSYLVWLLARQFSKYQYNIQREESLMIGRDFIGRYIEPNIWIIKGNKLEGTRLQRGVKTRAIRYDKSRGLLISWQSVSLNLLVIFIFAFTIIWIQLGALNISNLIYVFPFVFDRSINFISNKASAELGFFILAGYVFWGILFFNYPKYYARSRPQLFLEMQYPTSIPIILRNYKDHQDASIQFTKCLINASRPARRRTKGRPGLFMIKILLESIELLDKDLENHLLSFQFGETFNRGESILLSDYGSIKLALINRLRVSGELGFPRLKLFSQITGLKYNNDITESFDLEISKPNNLTIRYNDKLIISLSAVVETMIQ